MFCYQCEQTAKGTGCDVLGVCGKKPEVADLQDLLLYSLMGLSQVGAPEGRANPRQLWLHEGTKNYFADIVSQMRQAAKQTMGQDHEIF
ncbi:MAG: hypothetical protein R6V15_12575, partial [Desulfotignum sp.]